MAENTDSIFLVLSLGTGLMLILAIFIIVFTITYQRRLLAQKLRMQEIENIYQQELLEASIEIQENERKRIAGDLHDSIGANLSAIKLFTNQIYQKVTENSSPAEITLQTKDLIDETIQNVRQISRDLLPATLEHFGLHDAVQELCTKINAAKSIQIRFADNFNGQRLHIKKELALYRITQELINNTLKYAEASEINLNFQWEENSQAVYLTYSDNGKGFDFPSVRNRPGSGLGLKNIESRIKAIKGTVQFLSEIGQGTRVEATVPVKE